MATKAKPKQGKAVKPQRAKVAKPSRSAKPAKAAKPPKPAKRAARPQPKSKPAPRKAAPPLKAVPKSSKPQRKAEAAKPETAALPTLSSARPSSELSRSIPTPFESSQTDGGVRYLSVQDVVDLHKAVSAEFGGSQAHPGVIDSQFGLVSAVQRPQVTTLGREAYPAFSDKVAAFVFALLQARPFRGGNRRVALASLLAFCELNDRAVDSRVLDEKTAENLLKRAGGYREMGIPPESVFRELREVLGRAIAAQS